ncbi:MAG: methanogenesis marker 15 protein [Candidatus Lokiarchaeota archaeon]|nr:methanogenesis marker 15 protein [Candidatus Lokiarchaeota archaeon]
MREKIRIGQVSCGTIYSGVQTELDRAAKMVDGELVFPEVDLEYIEEIEDRIPIKVNSPNLRLAIARANKIIELQQDLVDAVLIVSCFHCTEGTLVRQIVRKMIQNETRLPLIMYSFTERPKLESLLIRMEALTTIVKKRALLGRQKQEGLTMGIDSGSSTTKCIIMEDNEIIGTGWVPTTKISAAAKYSIKVALEESGVSDIKQLDAIGVTGYGRYDVGALFNADLIQEEITVNSKGAVYLAKKQKGEATVIDIGGLDNKVMTLYDGIPDNFTMGGICAGSSGRFLELAARRIGVSLPEFSDLSMKGDPNKVHLDSYCSIFGIQSLVSELSRNKKIEDAAAAACVSVSEQVLRQQLQEIDIREPIIEIGGTALIKGLAKYLSIIIRKEIIIPEYPQYAGAVGAALLASK